MERTKNALRLLSDYLKNNACDYPNKTAFIYNDQRISYKEFNEKSEVLAKYLLKIGVNKQDRIAYLLDNQPEFFYLLMAASRIGAIIVGLGTRLMPSELKVIFNGSETEYLFITGKDKPYVSRVTEILPQCATVKKTIVVGGEESIPDATVFENIFQETYDEFDQALLNRESQIDTDDGLLMVYTSGSTGQPKGALLTHRNIIHSSLIEADVFESTPNDVWLENMPVNHVGGAIVTGTTPIVSASTLVLVENFSPSKTLELIEKEKVSILGQVPTMYAMELNLPNYDQYDKSSIRSINFGASLAPENILKKVISTMTPNVFNCLGMTEASGIVAYTAKGSDLNVLSKSVGKVIPEIEWKLVDKNRETVRQGEVGEAAYRGATIFKEYYGKPEATKQCIDDEGWFYSGDLFAEDKNGNLVLMGRKKEMFITGGENVYSCEVERAICSYEKVESVAVVSAPDPIYGDIGHAYIIPKSGCTIEEADLRGYLYSKLAKYKIPAKFIFRDELPLNRTGKISKKALKQEIAEELKG